MRANIAEMMMAGASGMVQSTLAAHGLAAGPSAQRASPPETGLTRHRTVTVHGSREWLLHSPARPAERPALVVMLHGCKQTAEDFAAGTGMNEAAERLGWHVAWPEQPGRANLMRCWSWYDPDHQAAGAGEPEILAAIIAHALDRIGAPGADVFVAGLSAGGAMAAVLADTHPGAVTAIGVHSGLPAGSGGSVSEAVTAMREGSSALVRSGTVPMIVIHGTEDQTVSLANGDALGRMIGGRLSRGETGGRAWARRKGSRGEYWRIEGLGHAWSGGRPEGSYADPHGPDATAHMLRFFRERRG